MGVTNGIIFGWVFVSRINFSLMITKAEKIVIQNCHKINQKWLTEEFSDKVVYYHFIYVVVSSSCFYNHIWKETLNSCKTIKLHGSCYRRFLANSIPKDSFTSNAVNVYSSGGQWSSALTLASLWAMKRLNALSRWGACGPGRSRDSSRSLSLFLIGNCKVTIDMIEKFS